MWLVVYVKDWLVRLGLPNRVLLNFNLSQVLTGLCFRHGYGKVALGTGPTRFEAEGLPRFPPVQEVLSAYSAGTPEPRLSSTASLRKKTEDVSLSQCKLF